MSKEKRRDSMCAKKPRRSGRWWGRGEPLSTFSHVVLWLGGGGVGKDDGIRGLRGGKKRGWEGDRKTGEKRKREGAIINALTGSRDSLLLLLQVLRYYHHLCHGQTSPKNYYYD